MELNQKIDAIIIGKIADRKSIDKIDSTNVLLNCLSIIGNISSQVKKGKSPVSFLPILFVNLTLLGRKANINIGAILDADDFSFKSNRHVQGLSISELTVNLCELNYNSLDFMSKCNHSKDELKSIHLNSFKLAYIILKDINFLAASNKSSFSEVQENAMKHLDQLIKTIN